MSDEQTATAESHLDALDFYKSTNIADRAFDQEMVLRAMDNRIVPRTVRYDAFREVYRGVVKSTTGELYYFNYTPKTDTYRIVKADTQTKQWEAERLLKNCKHGCDMTNEKQEDDEKAGKAGGSPADFMPPSIPEEDAVRTADSEVTERHPGATVASTPEQDGSAERWHGSGHIERALPPTDQSVNPNAWSTTSLLKAWGQVLQETAPRVAQIDPQERRFMIEVMGKAPEEVDSGRVQIGSARRAQYNQWLTRSTRTHMGRLNEWLSKSRNNG